MPEKKGASTTMNSGFRDWKKLAGISQRQPPSVSQRFVSFLANSVSEEPACSKADQKKMEKNTMIKITASRCFSTCVRLDFSGLDA